MSLRKSLICFSLGLMLAGCGDSALTDSGSVNGTSNNPPTVAASQETSGAPSATPTAGGAPEEPSDSVVNPDDPVTWEAAALGYVPGEVVVQYKAGASGETVRARNGLRTKQVVRKGGYDENSGSQGDLEVAEVSDGQDVEQAARELSNDPAVAYAEPNYIYNDEAVSRDPQFTNKALWGMHGPSTGSPYGTQASTAWAANHTGSATVYVGVLDEGVMYTHPDLNGAVGNPKERAGDGLDNDGNGKIDDTFGWDFLNNDKTVYDGVSDDHGTHVAGTIAARSNTQGVVGITWNTKIIPVKFMGSNGGTMANAVKGIDYLIDLKKKSGLNVVAINCSWGSSGFSQSLKDAIARARDADIFVVCAAGNENNNNDTRPSYPASYAITPSSAKPFDNVISVAALTKTGTRASFSNYGASSVDLAAPGASIVSTIPGSAAYASWNGTSMAAPHVAGAIALYKSTFPSASSSTVRSALLSKATVTPTLQNSVAGNKRLNVSTF